MVIAEEFVGSIFSSKSARKEAVLLHPAEVSTTPHLFLDPRVLNGRLALAAEGLNDLAFKFAYSVKTNPHVKFIQQATDLGMLMEVINPLEVNHVVDCGAKTRSIVLNGPAKWWKAPEKTTCLALFVDSPSEFDLIDRYLADGGQIAAEYIGLRLSTSRMKSRFGFNVDVDDMDQAGTRLAGLIDRLEAGWGIHYHNQQCYIGAQAWSEQLLAALKGVSSLQLKIGREPGLIDVGGGWSSQELKQFGATVKTVIARGPSFLASAELLWVAELGRALLEPCGNFFTTVIRGGNAEGDVLVDAALPNVPMTEYVAHPVYVARNGTFERVEAGSGRLLGRTCMESDVLAVGLDLEQIRAGDLIAIDLAGAYDYSMGFSFAQGLTTYDISVHG